MTHGGPYSYFVVAAAVVAVVEEVASAVGGLDHGLRDHVVDLSAPATYRETWVVRATFRVTWGSDPRGGRVEVHEDQVRVQDPVPWVVVQRSSLAYHHSYQAF